MQANSNKLTTFKHLKQIKIKVGGNNFEDEELRHLTISTLIIENLSLNLLHSPF